MTTRGGRRRPGTVLAALGLLTVLVAGGCSSGGDVETASDSGVARDSAGGRPGAGEAPQRGPAAAPAQPEGAPAQPGQGAADLRVEQRSIVYTGTMRVRVTDVEAAAQEAATAATSAGGFVGGDERRSAGAGGRAELTLRVPADRFAGVLDQLATLGRQESRNISTEDVTEEVVDLDARITTQRARVESARRLLARAEDIGDLVTVERELASREADLAALEAKKRRLADLTALSTITVTLVGPDASTADEDRTGFLAGLQAGWRVFGTSVTVLLTVLGALLPWLLVIGVPVGAFVAVLRRRRRRSAPPPAGRPLPAAGGPRPPIGGPRPPVGEPQPAAGGARSTAGATPPVGPAGPTG
ncbi:DUF4349 domain-containing protein [Micromonospora rosaria]